MRKHRLAITALGLLTVAPALHADEGMWTYDNFPTDTVRRQYGVSIDRPWLDRVRAATVRLSGCSASFVSGEGLILTNHHCIASCLAENSTKEKVSWMKASWLAIASRKSNVQHRSQTCWSRCKTSLRASKPPRGV